MKPTSEYDTTPVCDTCTHLLSIEFDNCTELKKLCGWYGEPSFACERSCATCRFLDFGHCLRAAPYFAVSMTDLCGGYQVR